MSHIGFIAAAYAITTIVLAGLVAWVIIDGRIQQAALGELERRGIRRAGRQRGGEAA